MRIMRKSVRSVERCIYCRTPLRDCLQRPDTLDCCEYCDHVPLGWTTPVRCYGGLNETDARDRRAQLRPL